MNKFEKKTLNGKSLNVNVVSVIGELHKSEGKLIEDALYYISSEAHFIIAVADGLGSCEFSRDGAQFAVEHFCTFFDQKLADGIVGISKKDILAFIDEWRQHFGLQMHKYDTTLQFAIIVGEVLMTGSIGDGCICLHNGQFHRHQNSEQQFSNFTQSLAHCNEQQICLSSFELNEGTLMIATDGVTNDLIEEQYAQFLMYVSAQIRTNAKLFQLELLDWVTNWQTNNHTDDRTIALIDIRKKD